jgi:enoyl-CoA hydratase
MSYQNIIVNTEESICTILINRTSQLNALNKETIEELNDAFLKADRNHQIRCIILSGQGTKAFVAGADIKEFAHFNKEQGANLARDGQFLLFNLIERLSTPVIAAINGFALGGGLELAMSCHIRIASDTSKLGLPEVSLGVIPGYGGTQRLAQLVGKGKAMEMIASAQMIDAQSAMQWGLVNQVCGLDELMEHAQKLALKISRNSPNAIALAIKSVNAGFSSEGYETEIESFGSCFESDDFKEGTTAFLEKRKPNF